MIMRTPGFLTDTLFYLRTLTTISVLSIGLQTYSLTERTSDVNTSGSIESLEVNLGELSLKATGRNTTEALTNLIRSANGLGMMPLEGRSFISAPQKEEPTTRRLDNSFSTMSFLKTDTTTPTS